MILGVPTLCRYDLLDELCESAESNTTPPERYIIVDNGGKYDLRDGTHPWAARAWDRKAEVFIVVPRENLGVAASWNAIMELAEGPVVISNDDVVLRASQLEEFTAALQAHAYVGAPDMSLFGCTPELRARIGWVDENFYPAYWEDYDYHHRISLSEISNTVIEGPARHGIAQTVAALTGDAKLAVEEGFRKNRLYYETKWGGMNPNETFTEPFGGHPPEGWRERFRDWGSHVAS